MNKELLSMLIRFYNMQAGSSCRANNEWNQKKVQQGLDRANGDANILKDHIKKWVAENPQYCKSNNCLSNCIDSFTGIGAVPQPQPTTENAVASSLGILEQALMEVIKKQSVPQIEADIKGECKQMLQDFIKQEYGTIERKIVTVIDGKKTDVKGFVHEKFDTVLKFVANDEPVFLTGPAGSGKNYICKQVADALGLDFYFTNAVTQEYKLTGFTDAMGNFQETQFYKAFTKGGVFMLDEMDASIPEVLVILNAAIANRYFDFPAPIGYVEAHPDFRVMDASIPEVLVILNAAIANRYFDFPAPIGYVEAHPDFRVIAAGNTVGQGADYEYVGRNQLDGASLDRFAVVQIDYSVEIENGMACDIELADFCREFRNAAKKAGVQVIVSYRAINRLAKMTKLLELTEALQTCLVKGLEKDDINIICNELKDSKYKEALKKVA